MFSALLFVAAALSTNKAIAHRVFDEVLTRGNFEVAGQLYAADFVNHGRTTDVSLERDQAAARGWLQAFPDLKIEPEITIAENDLVAVLWRASGTNLGAGNGIPATGRRVNARGITIWRIVGGRITEEWSEFSQLQLLKQLGLLPGAAENAPEPRPASHGLGAIPLASRRERERNRAIVESVFLEAVGKGKLELFGRIYDPAFVNHGVARDGGVEQEIAATRQMRALAPDLRVTVALSVAEGDTVAVVYTAEGTTSGKHARLRGMSVMRVKNGRITDEWSVLDQYQLLEALGQLPAR